MWGARGQEGTVALVRVCKSAQKTDFPYLIGKVTSECQRNGKCCVQVPVHRWWHRAELKLFTENAKVPNPYDIRMTKEEG